MCKFNFFVINAVGIPCTDFMYVCTCIHCWEGLMSLVEGVCVRSDGCKGCKWRVNEMNAWVNVNFVHFGKSLQIEIF